MTIIDLVIIVAVLASIVVGVIRGIVREAIAISALLVAIWAALHLGPYAGGWLGGSMGSTELELWAGRFLVFIIILAIGGLAGWGISKIVRMAGLTGTDRYLGGFFGLVRAVVLIGLFALLGRYAAFDAEGWWLDSKLIPYAETVADWIDVMAPKGMEMLQPEEMMDELIGLCHGVRDCACRVVAPCVGRTVDPARPVAPLGSSVLLRSTSCIPAVV